MELLGRRVGRLRGGRPLAGAAELRDVERFDGATDELFEVAAEGCGFIVERSAARMNWRYLDVRAGDFRARGAYEDEQLVGYAVTRLAGRRAFLADLLVAPGREDIVTQLVADAFGTASAAGAGVIRTWMQEAHPYRATLARAGFGRESTVDLRYRPGAIGAEELGLFEDEAGWMQYMIGDTDIV